MNAVDFFSGAGGLTIALQNAGFKVLFSNEINPKFAKTHEYNFPGIPLINKDIKEVGNGTILHPEHLGYKTVKELEEFWGVHNDDVEWYQIYEVE